MKPTLPDEKYGTKITIAENQSQYLPLVARVDRSKPDMIVTVEWELEIEERERIARGGKIRTQFLTFGTHFTPMIIEVTPPPDWAAGPSGMPPSTMFLGKEKG